MFHRLLGVIALSISFGMLIVIFMPGGIYIMAIWLAILGFYLLYWC